ncbi:MAG: DNA-binding response regulator [Phycisphaerales bacterium]|nr:MAG: DNA-binding response regulator [Phycisphaerales bacterium]
MNSRPDSEGDAHKAEKPISVLIIDDHALVRTALAHRLEQEPDIHVAAVASTADELERLVEAHQPTIVLLDIDMPGLDCFDAARGVSSKFPDVHVVFLSAFCHDSYIENALAAKAKGYLTKRESPEALIEALREVAGGGACYSEEVRARIVVDSRGTKLAPVSKSRISLLTTRETEILRYVAKGMSKKEIAGVTGLSVKTVDRHCANLMGKLDIHDRVELARFAIREGLAEV